ncbi:hypothetical protein CEUSTIGMA_g1273.t1 [Chlamydomonas eustigma]|uniref:Uncharacterized protein n=1 Tax=Chlamydomonas eustigma TaxID=1157962 RepID=A0A250WT36_9CHLO|nr:hypothetical protein CEUSTIGMA_g1273.t1 [Chlamydomonas eustigma]|eukprot:GAX73822.1 hypothetical protein CEUSTIGMA_g1273.t1 [Chlamydomonas eustigma]
MSLQNSMLIAVDSSPAYRKLLDQTIFPDSKCPHLGNLDSSDFFNILWNSNSQQQLSFSERETVDEKRKQNLGLLNKEHGQYGNIGNSVDTQHGRHGFDNPSQLTQSFHQPPPKDVLATYSQAQCGQPAVAMRLQLIPFNAASRLLVSSLQQPTNISIPINKGGKTLQSISKHYCAKWSSSASQKDNIKIRFHAASSLGQHLCGTSWGPDIWKGVTMDFLCSLLGARDTITLKYEVLSSQPASKSVKADPVLHMSTEQPGEALVVLEQHAPQKVKGEVMSALEILLQQLESGVDDNDIPSSSNLSLEVGSEQQQHPWLWKVEGKVSRIASGGGSEHAAHSPIPAGSLGSDNACSAAESGFSSSNMSKEKPQAQSSPASSFLELMPPPYKGGNRLSVDLSDALGCGLTSTEEHVVATPSTPVPLSGVKAAGPEQQAAKLLRDEHEDQEARNGPGPAGGVVCSVSSTPLQTEFPVPASLQSTDLRRKGLFRPSHPMLSLGHSKRHLPPPSASTLQSLSSAPTPNLATAQDQFALKDPSSMEPRQLNSLQGSQLQSAATLAYPQQLKTTQLLQKQLPAVCPRTSSSFESVEQPAAGGHWSTSVPSTSAAFPPQTRDPAQPQRHSESTTVPLKSGGKRMLIGLLDTMLKAQKGQEFKSPRQTDVNTSSSKVPSCSKASSAQATNPLEYVAGVKDRPAKLKAKRAQKDNDGSAADQSTYERLGSAIEGSIALNPVDWDLPQRSLTGSLGPSRDLIDPDQGCALLVPNSIAADYTSADLSAKSGDPGYKGVLHMFLNDQHGAALSTAAGYRTRTLPALHELDNCHVVPPAASEVCQPLPSLPATGADSCFSWLMHEHYDATRSHLDDDILDCLRTASRASGSVVPPASFSNEGPSDFSGLMIRLPSVSSQQQPEVMLRNQDLMKRITEDMVSSLDMVHTGASDARLESNGVLACPGPHHDHQILSQAFDELSNAMTSRLSLEDSLHQQQQDDVLCSSQVVGTTSQAMRAVHVESSWLGLPFCEIRGREQEPCSMSGKVAALECVSAIPRLPGCELGRGDKDSLSLLLGPDHTFPDSLMLCSLFGDSRFGCSLDIDPTMIGNRPFAALFNNK